MAEMLLYRERQINSGNSDELIGRTALLELLPLAQAKFHPEPGSGRHDVLGELRLILLSTRFR